MAHLEVMNLMAENNNFTDALELTGPLTNWVGNTVGTTNGFTAESGELPIANRAAQASAWFKITIPENKVMVFNAQQSAPLCMLGIFVGDSFDNMVELANNQPDFNPITICLSANVTYYVKIDTWHDDIPFVNYSLDYYPYDVSINLPLIDSFTGTGSLIQHISDSNAVWFNNINPYGADEIISLEDDLNSNDEPPAKITVGMAVSDGALNITHSGFTRAAECSTDISETDTNYDFEFGVNFNVPMESFGFNVIEFALGYVQGIRGYTFGISCQDRTRTDVYFFGGATVNFPYTPYALANGLHTFKVSIRANSTEIFVDGNSVFQGPADPNAGPGLIAFKMNESFDGEHQISLDSINLNAVQVTETEGINYMAGPFLSAIFNGQQFFHDDEVTPLSGGLIYTYVAGTTTPMVTYTAADGLVENSNPILLNADGRPPADIWFKKGFAYKLRLANENDVILRDYDNIYGINDMSLTGDAGNEWILGSTDPIYVTGDSFAIAGNQLDVYETNRRVRIEQGIGTSYGCVTNQIYDDVNTTVEVHLDSGIVDSGISLVHYALLSATHPSIPCQYAKLSGTHFTDAIIDNLTTTNITTGTLHVTGTSQHDGLETFTDISVSGTATINHLTVTGDITASGFGDSGAWATGDAYYLNSSNNPISPPVVVTVVGLQKLCISLAGAVAESGGSGHGASIFYQIHRDGISIAAGAVSVVNQYTGPISFITVDTPGAGTHTYQAYGYGDSGAAGFRCGMLITKVN